ncbi:MAG TPA: S41 family peptidase [candidate division Zixibacteria bacterium]|nr:S41 family peptidase [candidate division Zixibacteria bacterium]
MTQEHTRSTAGADDRMSQASLTLMLGSLFAALWMSLLLFVVSSPYLREALRLKSVVEAVAAEYSGEWDTSDMFENAAAELYGKLDRYSGYMPQTRFHQVDEELSGFYAGIGVSILSTEDGLLVAGVNKNGPARAAGVLIGDLLTAANGVDLVGRSTLDASLVLRGETDDTVAVTLKRPVGLPGIHINGSSTDSLKSLKYDTLSVSIVRASVPLEHIPYIGETDSAALYVRLYDFEAGAFDEFTHLYDSLRELGRDYRGIILDLRGNPGGLLSEALQFADFFLEDDILMLGKKGRSRWSRQEFYSSGDDETDGAPLAILLDRGSASASEVFAGALKYAGRATLVGDTTFGKGLVQSYRPFSDGSASRLTIARYYFSGEVYLNKPGAADVDSGAGIPPDVYFTSDGDGSFVGALERALLIYEFTARAQERIIELYNADDTAALIREFSEFVSATDFTYQSRTLAGAHDLYFWTRLGNEPDSAGRIAQEIVRRAGQQEADLFGLFAPALVRRLASRALERRDGDQAAFTHVLMKADPGIRRAEAVLRTKAAPAGA